ncbi:urea amidolyase family protein [Intrasporangium sp. DVR]|uniref:5-oxoprolinase subunit B/C family protein n=1 Tax=Intrasporangium sp. DVR TaxID=3127867 RepID=UPI00313A6E50
MASLGDLARILPMGDAALLVELDDLDQVLAAEARLEAAAHAGDGVWGSVDDVVPAARTVLVVGRPTTDLALLALEIRAALARPSLLAAGTMGHLVEIPVHYDGPDLDAVGSLTGLGREGVIAAHVAARWQVAFGGFAPGFAYLVGDDPRLDVPRRESPRTRVPAGAVALAGGFSGIYPRESPGGWQLIGTTEAVLWDVDRAEPALLTPGTTVRFRRAEHRKSVGAAGPAHRVARPAVRARRSVDVLEPGPLTLVQDLGRLGHLAVGVGRSGAADRGAHELGARLLGNPPGLAALEMTFGGLHLRARGDLLVCLTGAPVAATAGGRPVPHAGPFRLRDGADLSIRMPLSGLRTYLSFRGGLAVEPVLGSRSSDTMSGLGPAPLAAGDVIAVGDETAALPQVDVAPVPVPPSATETVTVGVLPGPRRAWFARPEALAEDLWTVSERSDRKGVRLIGTPVEWAPARVGSELPTEGMVLGAVQVPPDGQPVIFLNDHPVTGGYPVIGVVRTRDLDSVAQLVPGQSLRLRWQR